MAELGWPGLALPEEWGGQGLGIVELAVLFEEMGYALAPSPLFSNTIAGLALERSAAPTSSASATCAPLADGREARHAGALGRRLAGDARRLHDGGRRPTATASSSTARRCLVLDAASADFFLVATADGRRHLVERGADGVTVTPEPSIDLTRRLYSVSFDGVKVAAADAMPGEAADYYPVFFRLCVALAAESTGIAQRTMEMAVEYAKDRKQFGRPIGSYQAVSHRCAQMLLETENARSAVYGAAWAADAEPESLPLAASMAKAYASDAGWRVPDASIQVHGGIGFTWEHDLHFFLKRGARQRGDVRRRQVAPRAGRRRGSRQGRRAGPGLSGREPGMGALDRISVAAIGTSVADLEAETLRAEAAGRRVRLGAGAVPQRRHPGRLPGRRRPRGSTSPPGSSGPSPAAPSSTRSPPSTSTRCPAGASASGWARGSNASTRPGTTPTTANRRRTCARRSRRRG